MPIEKKANHEGFLKINQSLGSKTFYDLQGSYQVSSYTEGDGIFQFNTALAGRNGYTYPWYDAYGDTNVVPGLNNNGVGQGSVTPSSAYYGVFRDVNRIYNLATKNKSEQYSANLNFTHQILTKKYGNHEIKFGGEYHQYKLRYFYLNPAGYAL